MRQAVLADSGPLYAALDPHDAHHERARSQLHRLARDKYEVAVCFPTLLEAYTLALFRLGRSIALGWLGEMRTTQLLNPTAEDYHQAAARLSVLPDQSITLFDATLAVVALRTAIPVWTYDHHFDVMRIPVWR